MLARLSGHAAYEGVKKEFAAIVERACEQIVHKLANKEIAELRRVKTYIEEHYAENITLESMAAMIYMNPYYFSSFSKTYRKKFQAVFDGGTDEACASVAIGDRPDDL
ncbi:hypothetical protein HMSSN036_83520 [Paenibacillus macerans]|nr:hypothetical protein HMSSN036_83520 [Paenibacillus macerans]